MGNESQELLANFLGKSQILLQIEYAAMYSCNNICNLVASEICLINEKVQSTSLIIPQEMEFVHFNVPFAHLFAALTRSQAMSMIQVNMSSSSLSLSSWTVTAVFLVSSQRRPSADP
jgi:hypothetical protein